MNPIRFEQGATLMRKPEGWTEEQCSDIHVFVGNDSIGQPVVISCWQPTNEERVKIAAGGPVWLTLIGPTMQPAHVSGNSPFATE